MPSEDIEAVRRRVWRLHLAALVIVLGLAFLGMAASLP